MFDLLLMILVAASFALALRYADLCGCLLSLFTDRDEAS